MMALMEDDGRGSTILIAVSEDATLLVARAEREFRERWNVRLAPPLRDYLLHCSEPVGLPTMQGAMWTESVEVLS